MTEFEALAARACCLLILVIAGAGYFTVVAPSEGRIAGSTARADVLLAQVLADEETVRNADRLERAQRDIAIELQGVNLRTDRTGLVASLLRDLERIASANRIRVVSLQSEPAPQTRVEEPFDAAFLDIVLEGRYDSVLQTIAGLSRARVLTRIVQSSIDRAKGRQEAPWPVLLVQLKVAIFHLQGLQQGEKYAGTKST